jgi:hypothetical protein
MLDIVRDCMSLDGAELVIDLNTLPPTQELEQCLKNLQQGPSKTSKTLTIVDLVPSDSP